MKAIFNSSSDEKGALFLMHGDLYRKQKSRFVARMSFAYLVPEFRDWNITDTKGAFD